MLRGKSKKLSYSLKQHHRQLKGYIFPKLSSMTITDVMANLPNVINPNLTIHSSPVLHPPVVVNQSLEPKPQYDTFKTNPLSLLHRWITTAPTAEELLISTEERNSSPDLSFFGPYASIRRTLDHNYHKNYKDYRQGYQDAIITDLLSSVTLTDVNGDVCTTPTDPWIVFTAGAMGAGKGHTIDRLVMTKRFPLLAFVRVDPDEIRRLLPEFAVFAEQRPLEAGELTRKEAGYVSEILTAAGLRAGKNVLVDGSLRDWRWYEGYFARLREEYPGLKIAILHVTAPREAVFERAAARAKITGRVVPPSVLEDALHTVPQSVAILAPLADYVCEIDNAPYRDDVTITTPGETWDTFRERWNQTCAWVPGRHRRRRSLSPPPRTTTPIVADDDEEEMSDDENDAALRAATSIARRRSIEFVRERRRSRAESDRRRRCSRSPPSRWEPTEERYRSNDERFYGPNAHLRRLLYDDSFHPNYVKERQWLQDAIIEDLIGSASPYQIDDDDSNIENVGQIYPKNPWIVFTAGARGAGKHHLLQHLRLTGQFPLLPWITCNADDVRRHLPEYELCRDTEELQSRGRSITRTEAGYVAELMCLAALRAGRNVHFDGALERMECYEGFFRAVRREYGHVNMAILHVTAPLEDILRRNEKLAKRTGLNIPRGVIEASLQKIHLSLEGLSKHVDYYCELNNPDGGDVEIRTDGVDWNTFRKRWVQTLAWEPGMWKTQLEEIRKGLENNR